MKSVEFLIDSRLRGKKISDFSPKIGGSTWSSIIFRHKRFLSNYIPSKCRRNFLSKNVYCRMVQAKSYPIMTVEIGKFRCPNLFLIPVKNTQNLGF